MDAQEESKRLDDIAGKFPGANYLGTVELKDGKLSEEQEAYLRERFSKMIEEVEPDPTKRAESAKRLEETLDGIRSQSAPGWQIRINMAKARFALKKIEESILDLIPKHAGMLEDGRKVFEFGCAHGLLSTGIASLEGALERLDHAFDCPCHDADAEHADAAERPTEPPPAEEASA